MNTIIPSYILARLEKKRNVRFLPDRLSGKFRYKRSQALLRQPAALPGQSLRLIYDSQNSETQRLFLMREEGQGRCGDIDADSAYDLAGIVHAYLLEQLHWNSLDNRGMNLVSNVHLGKEYNNAFWDGDEMSYGDGDGKWFTGFARAIDVTAHEMAHGIIQYTAGLLYDGQPGALNEHFADMLATAVKQHHKGQNASTGDWLLGDEVMGPELAGRAIRSLKEPESKTVPLDPQPAHMEDYYKGDEDNHGVHINSGIPNKAFYLVAMETGTQAAARLWFTALKKLKPASKFTDLYEALTASVLPLVHAGHLPLNGMEVLDKAFESVGIKEARKDAKAQRRTFRYAP